MILQFLQIPLRLGVYVPHLTEQIRHVCLPSIADDRFSVSVSWHWTLVVSKWAIRPGAVGRQSQRSKPQGSCWQSRRVLGAPAWIRVKHGSGSQIQQFAKNRWNRRACESGMVVMMVVMMLVMMMMVPPYFCLSAKFCRARCCAWGIAGWGSPLRYGPFGLWLQDPGHFTDQHEQYVSLAPLQKPGGLGCLGWTQWTNRLQHVCFTFEFCSNHRKRSGVAHASMRNISFAKFHQRYFASFCKMYSKYSNT
jgi:hypothetical protein